MGSPAAAWRCWAWYTECEERLKAASRSSAWLLRRATDTERDRETNCAASSTPRTAMAADAAATVWRKARARGANWPEALRTKEQTVHNAFLASHATTHICAFNNKPYCNVNVDFLIPIF